MCGLIAVLNTPNAREKVKELYNSQVSRGTQGYGFIEITPNKPIVLQRALTADEMRPLLETAEASDIIFHHRLPTSTGNYYESTHPIHVSNKELHSDYYVMHNGVIRNDELLRQIHTELGYTYVTSLISESYPLKPYKKAKKIVSCEYNDSEALAIELARYVEGLKDTIDTEGNVAFIMLQVNKDTQVPEALYIARNEGNPLQVQQGQRADFSAVSISSENKEVSSFSGGNQGLLAVHHMHCFVPKESGWKLEAVAPVKVGANPYSKITKAEIYTEEYTHKYKKEKDKRTFALDYNLRHGEEYKYKPSTYHTGTGETTKRSVWDFSGYPTNQKGVYDIEINHSKLEYSILYTDKVTGKTRVIKTEKYLSTYYVPYKIDGTYNGVKSVQWYVWSTSKRMFDTLIVNGKIGEYDKNYKVETRTLDFILKNEPTEKLEQKGLPSASNPVGERTEQKVYDEIELYDKKIMDCENVIADLTARLKEEKTNKKRKDILKEVRLYKKRLTQLSRKVDELWEEADELFHERNSMTYE